MISAFLTRDIPYHSGGRMMPEHFSHKQMHKLSCDDIQEKLFIQQSH